MYKALDKKGITVMRINAIITGLITLVILGIGIYFIYPLLKETFHFVIFYIIVGIIIILVFLDIFLFPRLRYNRYSYLIDKDRIEVKKGLFFITTSIILIKRIQKVELSTGPIDRLFNLSNVTIYTAAGNVLIKFLNTDEALKTIDKINALLKQKLGKKKQDEN